MARLRQRDWNVGFEFLKMIQDRPQFRLILGNLPGKVEFLAKIPISNA